MLIIQLAGYYAVCATDKVRKIYSVNISLLYQGKPRVPMSGLYADRFRRQSDAGRVCLCQACMPIDSADRARQAECAYVRLVCR